MSIKVVDFGERYIQKNSSSFTLTLPIQLVRVLGLREGEKVKFSLDTDSLRILIEPREADNKS